VVDSFLRAQRLLRAVAAPGRHRPSVTAAQAAGGRCLASDATPRSTDPARTSRRSGAWACAHAFGSRIAVLSASGRRRLGPLRPVGTARDLPLPRVDAARDHRRPPSVGRRARPQPALVRTRQKPRGLPQPPDVQRHFGSWEASLIAARLEVQPRLVGPHRVWSKPEILLAFTRWAAEHERPRASGDWRPGAPERPCSKTVCIQFGSWHAALEAAGLEGQPIEKGTRRCKRSPSPAARGLTASRRGSKLRRRRLPQQ
jgi:hypothetical protein